MSTHAGIRIGRARCSAATRRYIEEQYERYLANPAERAGRVARVLRRAARRRGRTSRTRRSSQSFIELGKQPQGRGRDGRCVDDAQAGARAAADQQVPHARDVPRRPRSAEAAGDAATSPTSTSRPTASPTADLDTEFDVGSFKAGTDADAAARPHRRARSETYCRTLGAEYMYISDTPTKRFVQERLEPIRARPTYTPRSSGTSSSG